MFIIAIAHLQSFSFLSNSRKR